MPMTLDQLLESSMNAEGCPNFGETDDESVIGRATRLGVVADDSEEEPEVKIDEAQPKP